METELNLKNEISARVFSFMQKLFICKHRIALQDNLKSSLFCVDDCSGHYVVNVVAVLDPGQGKGKVRCGIQVHFQGPL